MSDFSLDLAENPHPRMLAGALAARRVAQRSRRPSDEHRYWNGYRQAMCDATGETPEAIDAWLDRHEAVQ